MSISIAFQESYDKLNKNQRLAVDSTEGPIMVLAGPGTGKTEVLAVRIGNILNKTDMQPSNILCLTFSNAGVQSMKKRLKELIGKTSESITVETFHAFSHFIVSSNFSVSSTNNKSLLTNGQRYMILEKLLFNQQLAGTYYDPKPPSEKKLQSLASIFNLLKKESITSEQISAQSAFCIDSILAYEEEYLLKNGELNAAGRKLQDKIQHFSDAIGPMYDAYNEILEQRDKYEFQDMLAEAIAAFQNDASLLLDYQERFQYILVDEFQDTNTAQLALIQLLIKDVENPNLFIVGDDDQCIYKFQGANQKNFDWINQMLPKLNTILLDTNYRSTPSLLNHSFELIRLNQQRHPLKRNSLIAGNTGLMALDPIVPGILSFENDEQEAYSVAAEVSRLIHEEGENGKIAILYRTNMEAVLIKKWLKYFNVQETLRSVRGNILDTTYGKTLYNSLQCLKFLDKDLSIADAYFCQLMLINGQSKALTYAYILYKREKQSSSFITWLHTLKGDERINTLQIILDELLSFENVSNELITDQILAKWSRFIITCLSNYPLAILKDEWESFVNNFIKSDKKPSLSTLADLLQYYYHYQLSIDYVIEQDQQSQVQLCTIHGSKGLEFDTVFVIGCQDKNWEEKGETFNSINVPKILNRYICTEADDNEDLRRVIYVAITRARKRLWISYSRKSSNDKNHSLSNLLQPLVENGTVNLLHKPMVDLPVLEQEVYSLELEDDFTELIRDRLNNFQLSPSSTHNWVQCQNKFFFQNICKLPSLPAEAMSFGSLVHKVLETISISGQLQPNSNSIAMLVEELFVIFQFQFHPLHRSAYKEYAKLVVKNYLSFSPILSRPTGTEKFVNYCLENGVRINGVIDRLNKENNSIEVIDYKTGLWPQKMEIYQDELNAGNQYWRQAMMYYLLLKRNYPAAKNIELSFHYVELNKIVTFQNQENRAFEGWLSNIWQQIQQLKFSKQCDDKDCIYCKSRLN
jgi:DNA helicase-2/ATP-dependent DNA helicase PcrA